MMQGTITVNAVAGIDDHLKTGFEFYPNPTTDVLTITGKEIIDRIEIYDSAGKQLMNSVSATADNKIYFSNYPAGTYYVKVFSAAASKAITVIKE